MDTNNKFKQIDIALESLPEEIRSFLFDGEFDAVFEVYKLKYTDQEKFLGIKNKTLECILGLMQIVELKTYVEQNTEDKQLADALKKDIQEKVIDEVLLIIEIHKEMRGNRPVQETSTPQNTTIPHFTQPFTTPATLAPTKRVYTELPSTPSVPTTGSKPLSETLPISKPSIDPYRELPDVK